MKVSTLTEKNIQFHNWKSQLRHPTNQIKKIVDYRLQCGAFPFFQSTHMFFSTNEVWLKSFSGANKDPFGVMSFFCVPLLISLWVMGKYFVMGCYWFVSIPVSFSHIIGHWHFQSTRREGTPPHNKLKRGKKSILVGQYTVCLKRFLKFFRVEGLRSGPGYCPGVNNFF